MNLFFVNVFFIVGLIQLSVGSGNKNTYRAAVVEYSPDIPFSDDIKIIYRKSVADYKHFIQEAAKQNVDIIVFPEDGLSTLNVPAKRNKIHSFATKIPNPNDKISPCNTPGFSEHLTNLSCEASANKIYVVVNLIEYVNCQGEDGCPCDNSFYFNTNLVFDRNGVVIARYRKYNLFVEPGFDVTKQPEIVTFTTDFGVTFGMFICFDILFKEPAITLVKDKQVHDIIYSTAWFSELPFLTAIQTQAGWAYGNDVTVLASGYDNPNQRNVGSGIYVGRAGSIIEYFPLQRNNRLLVANVPKYPFKNTDQDIRKNSIQITENDDSQDDLVLFQEDLSGYTSEILTDTYENKLCNNDLCCNFEIKSTPLKEASYVYRAVVFSGQRNYAHIVQAGTQVCGIVSCLKDTIESCGIRNKTFETGREFHSIKISGNFHQNENNVQWPSTVNTHFLPLDPLMFTYENKNKNIELSLNDDIRLDNLFTFAIYGRDYSHDQHIPQTNHAEQCNAKEEL
ncbi:vanin-like protein 1 isoform X2 [Chrysoperla carnea]|uniref:vanin-like protein 1 isoform X2 n=1 Tax=Chrysoperla carnea TaxID=189513 RepID=UPI001D0615C6|nr:vanin-like protein 1 isoform X2 [Chrysoperla carnea]